MNHPIQPLELDEHGTVRFKKNKIVEYLLESGSFTMNTIARLPFSDEDREQFAQLIGYSLTGFSELGYVRDETFHAASAMYEKGVTEDQARIESLTDLVKTIKDGLREPISVLFNIHPQDLK